MLGEGEAYHLIRNRLENHVSTESAGQKNASFSVQTRVKTNLLSLCALCKNHQQFLKKCHRSPLVLNECGSHSWLQRGSYVLITNNLLRCIGFHGGVVQLSNGSSRFPSYALVRTSDDLSPGYPSMLRAFGLTKCRVDAIDKFTGAFLRTKSNFRVNGISKMATHRDFV